MDLSQDYILMCEKAQEIQELRKYSFEHADFYCDGYSNGKDIQIYFVSVSDINNHNENCFGTEKGENIWLPRQDQLQSMIEGTVMEKIAKINQMILPPLVAVNDISEEKLEEFRREWMRASSEPILTTDIQPTFEIIERKEVKSFEQMWLQFVMLEKYNKKWNNETKEWEVM